MKNIQNNDSTFWEKFKILLIDFTSVFFLFHIFRFFVSYFSFISFLPSFLILWLAYNMILLGVWQHTLGSSFLGLRLVNQSKGNAFRIRIVMRELFTSCPGILLIVFCFIRYIPANLKGFPIGLLAARIIPWAAVGILVILFFIILFRMRIFKVKMAKNISIERINSLKHTRKRIIIIYSILLLFAGLSRYFHTCFTNDVANVRSFCEKLPFKSDPNNNILDLLDWSYYTAPRPTIQSVQEYTNFLKTNRKNINDYIFSLFDKYDHVILCERMHPEMTQYDMIYDLVTDSRFVDKVGHVFTEIGNIDSRKAYEKLTNTNFSNDTVFQQALSSFMMENQSYHLLWSNTNWFNFLSKMYYFNHNKEKKVEILFTDRASWKFNDKRYERDQLMADNIISTIKKDTLKKSLIIMNYRHAYLRGEDNCGYYVSKKFPGKVANLLINTNGIDMFPLQTGKWDVAFEQMPEDAYAFDLKDSPFGKDSFDHFIFFSPLTKLRYEDMFTGVIYYKPLYLHYTGNGFPYMMQPNNIETLKKRALKLGEPFNENYYHSSNGYLRVLKIQYFAINLFDNLYFVWTLIWGVGILIYLSIVFIKTNKT